MIARSRPTQLTHLGPRDEEVRQRPLDFRLIGRLMQFTRPYAARRNGLLLMVLLRSIQLPCLTWVIAAVINGPIAHRNAVGVFWGAVGFTLLALSTQIVMHFRQRWALELGEAVVSDLRNALFQHIQTMPMSWFHRTKLGRVISRIVSDVEDVRIGVQEVLFVTLVQVGQMLIAAFFMVYYDWQLFLLVLGLAPVIWAINHYFHRRLSKALRDMRESFSRVTATLAESVMGIRVTQAFVRHDENARMFHGLVSDHSKNNLNVMRTNGLFLPLLDLNSQLFIAVLVVIGGYRVLESGTQAHLGDLVGFLFMAGMFFTPISNLGHQYNQAMTAMAAAERLFKLLDTAPAWSDPPLAFPLPRLRGKVEFSHVDFGYDPQRLVLHDIHFAAEPGQTVALVGHTGSGKSSIVNLIAKFYLPTAGQILVDGYDLNDISSTSLQRQLGIVLQQNFLFRGTVADNIRVGKPDATDHELLEAVERLGCTDLLVDKLPAGLASEVGERGGSLSLGQRQLVCFARALLADPRLLILDEATSSIDTYTEQRLQEALQVLLDGRTSFIVAHRMSTIRKADLVLVLDHGRIVERGQHAQLLPAGGVYAQLYKRFQQAA